MAFNAKDNPAVGGYKAIYHDLLRELANANLAVSADHLALPLNRAGEVLVPFLGRMFLVSNNGVHEADGRTPSGVTQSVLIRYILRGSCRRPAGEFVTLTQLAGPLFQQGSYTASALERPIIKRFKGRLADLLSVAASMGGRPEGEGGLGSTSLVFDVLPHVLVQLIFYDRDDEFPARATLLFDRHAAQVIDFETLAVMVTLFVQLLTRP